MEWYEDPVRARDEVRRATWRGAWRMLGAFAIAGFFVAILFPVFRQSKVGPKLTASSVAGAIEGVHRDTGRWPTSFVEVGSRITFDDRLRPRRVGFLKVADHGDVADYAVAFDGNLMTYRLGGPSKVEKLASATPWTLPWKATGGASATR